MVFAFRANVFGAAFGTGGTTWNGTTSAAINSGDLLIFLTGGDNLDAADGETAVVSTVSVGGQALTKLREYTNGQGAPAAGATVSVWVLQNSLAKAGGSATQITFSGSIAANSFIGRCYAFTMDNAQTLTEVDHAFSTGDGSVEPGDITLSGLVNAPYLFFRFIGIEGSTVLGANSTGWTGQTGAANGVVSVGSESHIVTATTDTSTVDLAAALDSASVMVALSEGTPGGGDTFFENKNPIEQGMKPWTAAGIGGALIE